jgi:hypothetical protein
MWLKLAKKSQNKLTKTKKTKSYGTGEGSNNSPFIWTLLSSETIKIYDNYAKGAE